MLRSKDWRFMNDLLSFCVNRLAANGVVRIFLGRGDIFLCEETSRDLLFAAEVLPQLLLLALASDILIDFCDRESTRDYSSLILSYPPVSDLNMALVAVLDVWVRPTGLELDHWSK